MHFHLPKPLHGWREFAGEVGIIVIGVLIALGAGQVVEAIHWRGQVADTRQSLNAELAEARSAAAEQRINHDCNSRKLAALDSITDQSEVPSLQIILFGLRPWSTSTWEAATASGAIAHMPLEERNRYAGLFGMVKVLGSLHNKAFETTNDLRTLAHHRRLTDVARDRLQADIARLRGLNFMLDLGSGQFIHDSAPLHLQITAEDVADLARDREMSRACSMPDAPAGGRS